ncbi:hypothetical protein Tco_1259883 [Tanacetum coccineum]
MDDPNITMEEYIRLEEEKAQKRGKVFNWETARYAIVFNNNVTSNENFLNDNDKVNIPFFLSPEPTISYFDDLDYFNNFEKEFPAIVYNDALTSKLDLLTEPTESPQHIDEFDLNDEISLSECDEEDNDDDKVDIKHSSGDMSVIPLSNVINVNGCHSFS